MTGQNINIFNISLGAPELWYPGHQKSGALPSWPTGFCFNLKNGLQKYEFLFFAKCLHVFHTKPGYFRTLPAWNGDALMRKHSKRSWGHQCSGARAPEVWCPSELTNRFSVLISRMGIRNMNVSCTPSVFMCFTQNLVILEHCQHKMSMHWSENPLKKGGGTRVLVPGHQKSGALSSWPTGFLF